MLGLCLRSGKEGSEVIHLRHNGTPNQLRDPLLVADCAAACRESTATEFLRLEVDRRNKVVKARQVYSHHGIVEYALRRFRNCHTGELTNSAAAGNVDDRTRYIRC